VPEIGAFRVLQKNKRKNRKLIIGF